MTKELIYCIIGIIFGAIMTFIIPICFGYSIRKIPTIKDIIEEEIPDIKNN